MKFMTVLHETSRGVFLNSLFLTIKILSQSVLGVKVLGAASGSWHSAATNGNKVPRNIGTQPQTLGSARGRGFRMCVRLVVSRHEDG